MITISAIAELVSYMEESALDKDTVPVFKLSDLIKQYIYGKA